MEERTALLPPGHEREARARPRTSRWVAVGTACGVVSLVFGLASVARTYGGSLSASGSSLMSSQTSSLAIHATNEYEATTSTELYPWIIVEPHRATTLLGRFHGDRGLFSWRIASQDAVLLETPWASDATLSYNFSQAATKYQVTLMEKSQDTGVLRATAAVLRPYGADWYQP